MRSIHVSHRLQCGLVLTMQHLKALLLTQRPITMNNYLLACIEGPWAGRKYLHVLFIPFDNSRVQSVALFDTPSSTMRGLKNGITDVAGKNPLLGPETQCIKHCHKIKFQAFSLIHYNRKHCGSLHGKIPLLL